MFKTGDRVRCRKDRSLYLRDRQAKDGEIFVVVTTQGAGGTTVTLGVSRDDGWRYSGVTYAGAALDLGFTHCWNVSADKLELVKTNVIEGE